MLNWTQFAYAVMAGLVFATMNATPTKAEIRECPKQSPADVCGACESNWVEKYKKLLEDARGPMKDQLTTTTKFLVELKRRMPELFVNQVIMEHSASAQASSPGNPRILIKSPESELVVGYNTDPKAAGYDRVEAITWNGAKAEFEFWEIVFPRDTPLPERLERIRAGNPLPHSPQVAKNPPLCLQCHAVNGNNEDPKPNWDPYYFWAGQLPFRQDLLLGGTKEIKRYQHFYSKQVPNDERLSLLPIPKDVKEWQETKQWSQNASRQQLKRPLDFLIVGLHRVDHVGGSMHTIDNSGPGTRMFNQMAHKNFCRIDHKLQKAKSPSGSPVYSKYKYAVAGAAKVFNSRTSSDEARMGCQNVADFYPEWYVKHASRFYSASKQWVTRDRIEMPAIEATDINSLYASVRANTKARQDFHFTDKKERQLKHWRENVFPGDENAFKRELGRFNRYLGIEDREKSLGHLAKLRLAVEPWGVDTRNFSLSNHADTMTYGDFFVNEEFPRMATMRAVEAEYAKARAAGETRDFCTWTAAKSRAAIGESANPALQEELDRIVAKERELTQGPPVLVSDPHAPGISDGAPSTFKFPDTCVACHVQGAVTPGLDRTEVPTVIFGGAIPLNDEAALIQKLKAPGSTLLEKLVDRVSRPDGAAGKMPFPPAKSWSTEQIRDMKIYLEQLKNR